MEELKFKDILKIIRVKKISILVIVAISIILGSIYSFKCTIPRYKSTATIILGTVSSIDNPNSNFIEYNSTSREILIATYKELSNSSSIMKEVSEKINKSANVEELVNSVKISQIGKTDMIKITATNVNSTVARDVVKEVINVLDKHIKEIYKIEKNYIIDEPTINKTSYNIHHALDIAISAIIGIVISLMYVTIIYNKQKFKNEIETNSNKKELIKVKINEKICLFIKDKCMNLKKMIFTLFEKKEKILDEEQEKEEEIMAEEKGKIEEEARKAKEEEKAKKVEIEKKKAEEKAKRNKEKQERRAIKKEEWNKIVSDFKLKSEEKKAKFLEKCRVKKERILEDFKIQKEKYNEYKIKKSEEKRIASEEKAKKTAMIAEEKAIRNAELAKIREEERIKKEEEKLKREEEKRLANEEKARQAAIIAEERAKKAAIMAEEKAKKEAELAKIREEERIRKEEEKAKKEAEAKFTDEYLEENLYPKTKYSKF